MKQNNLTIENHLSQYPKLVQELRAQVSIHIVELNVCGNANPAEP